MMHARGGEGGDVCWDTRKEGGRDVCQVGI